MRKARGISFEPADLNDFLLCFRAPASVTLGLFRQSGPKRFGLQQSPPGLKQNISDLLAVSFIFQRFLEPFCCRAFRFGLGGAHDDASALLLKRTVEMQ